MESLRYVHTSPTLGYVLLTLIPVLQLQGQIIPTPLYSLCTGEYSTNLTISSDGIFEVTLNTTNQSNQSDVETFLADLNFYLSRFCGNNTNFCAPSIDDCNITLSSNLTTVYSCSLGTAQLLLGLVYSYNGRVVSTDGVLDAFQDGMAFGLLGYDFSIDESTQNRTNALSTGQTGLTTDQIIWVSVGVTVSAILVSVLSGVLVVLSLISDRKAKKAHTGAISLDTTKAPFRGNSPVLSCRNPLSEQKEEMIPLDDL